MFSAYAHFEALNPLAPDAAIGIPEHGRSVKGWSIITALVWWLWVAGTFGWAGEVGRAWVSIYDFSLLAHKSFANLKYI